MLEFTGIYHKVRILKLKKQELYSHLRHFCKEYLQVQRKNKIKFQLKV